MQEEKTNKRQRFLELLEDAFLIIGLFAQFWFTRSVGLVLVVVWGYILNMMGADIAGVIITTCGLAGAWAVMALIYAWQETLEESDLNSQIEKLKKENKELKKCAEK